MSAARLMDSVLEQMPFLFFPDGTLAVTELNVLQCQDKTALKKNFPEKEGSKGVWE